jgi:restriction system protein
VLAASPPSLVDVVAFNGHVRSKDRATGKAVRPCLVSVRSIRDDFEDLVLDEPALDPIQCLRHLNAIVSQHPYDLEPIRPVVTFDLSKYKFAPEVDVVAGLDSRPDLMALDPIEFEHLIRRLFEAYGMKAWVTQASRDDGIDAVATNEDPMTGGLCIIQAKRTKNTVPAEAVRALAGVMHDKAAAKGILVTTAWFGKTSLDFAQRTGRMQLIDGRGLKALLQEQHGYRRPHRASESTARLGSRRPQVRSSSRPGISDHERDNCAAEVTGAGVPRIREGVDEVQPSPVGVVRVRVPQSYACREAGAVDFDAQ